MKTSLPLIRSIFSGTSILLVAAVALPVAGRAQASKTFATPEEAVAALASSIKAKDAEALRAIFGPAIEEISNPDRVQATNEFIAFAVALDQASHIIRESDGKCVLEMGTNAWPFPIPIVRKETMWFFDTAAGTEELVNRRIGKNELAALQVMRAYVDAQREYASRDRDGDGVLEYAQKIASTTGQTDGLYWDPEVNGEISPLGPWVALAQGEGYFSGKIVAGADPQPFHGYFFKILTRQGKNAPGGKYSYVINGNMIGGFALVGWPASYGDSGIMTFIVNQQGRVNQKDLGPRTDKVVSGMKAYDPEPTWQLSPD